MITITLPSDIEMPIAEEARRLGTTAELLAIESLRRLFFSVMTDKTSEKETLFEYLSGCIGTVDGTTEALSENCGKRFTESLVRKKHRMNL